ncbi:MAG: hypothetical protein H6741_35245 [Alphaproteobacteria bacterium]|nr:hypothetical protein [Alphaproteobacteria bacterium]
MTEPFDDAELWDDDLLAEEPDLLAVEPEGPVTDDEELDDLTGLLEEPQPDLDPRFDEAQIGADGDDFDDLEGLLDDPADEGSSWLQEDDEGEPSETPLESPPTAPAWRVARPPAPPRPQEPLVVGYRLKVGLPDFGVEGLPGRCMPHRAWSALRIPMRGEDFRSRVRLSFGGRDLSLPLIDAEGPAVRLQLVVRDRRFEVTLRLTPADGRVSVQLGRDALAAGALVIDVREDER